MTPGEIMAAYRLGKTGINTARRVSRIIPIIIILAIAVLVGGFVFKGKIVTQRATALFQNVLHMGAKTETSANNNKTKATVIRVVDGDTLKVKLNGKETIIRLIGIDCPESVSATRSKNTKAGKKASNFSKKKLSKGRTVWLQYGNKIKEDQYGRTLAFLYIKNRKGKKVMYNRILLKQGMARAAYYQNTGNPYRKNFRQLAQNAKLQKKGFWKKGFVNAFPGKEETKD